MTEGTASGSARARLPEPNEGLTWKQEAVDAASALLQDLLFTNASSDYVTAVLDIALMRKSCHALLGALDLRSPSNDPALELTEEGHATVMQMPEAVFLAILARNPSQIGTRLGHACVSHAAEAQLAHAAKTIGEDESLSDADTLEAYLVELHAGLSAHDIITAAADPAFLLQVMLLVGGNDASGAKIDDILYAVRQLINASRVAAAAALLAARGNTEGANIFNLLHTQAETAQRALAGEVALVSDVSAIDPILQAVERAEAGLLAEPSRLSDYVARQKTAILTALATSPMLRGEDRRRYYEAARQSFVHLYLRLRATGQALNEALSQEARLNWMSAELETGERRAECRTAAITRLHELLAMAALEESTFPRLIGIATISIALGKAYYETGQPRTAIDQAIVARRIAREASEIFIEAMRGSVEANSELARLTTSALTAIVAEADRTDIIARARLAESSGDFAQASQLYAEASEVETELKARVWGLLSTLFGDAAKNGALLHLELDFEAEARGTHFAGMAAINQADAALMEGNQKSARTGYEESRAQLERAAELWDAVRARRPPGSQADEAARQAQVSALRARYCDCKMEFAQAENLVLLRDHIGAAQKYIAARTVLQELIDRSLDVDESRNQQILVASKIYADARGLFEVDLDARTDRNLKRARQHMAEAAAGFAKAGESRWAIFVRGQSAECEAQVLRIKAEDEKEDPLREALLTRASDRRTDAADIYALAGHPKDSDLSRNGSGAGKSAAAPPALLVLPKPQAPVGEGVHIASAAAARDTDKEIAKAARIRALQMTIDEMKEMRDRAILEPGRYSALVTDFREKLFQLTAEPGEASE
jgi:hypothetical protein